MRLLQSLRMKLLQSRRPKLRQSLRMKPLQSRRPKHLQSRRKKPSNPQAEHLRSQTAPPDALVETPSAPSVDVETAPPQSDFAAYARFASPLRTNPYADFDDAEREIYLKAHLNLCASVEAIVSLIRAVRYIVENKIPGAFIECGVFMGGNIEVMIRTLQTAWDHRSRYLPLRYLRRHAATRRDR